MTVGILFRENKLEEEKEKKKDAATNWNLAFTACSLHHAALLLFLSENTKLCSAFNNEQEVGRLEFLTKNNANHWGKEGRDKTGRTTESRLRRC